jgi:hypothetical protein
LLLVKYSSEAKGWTSKLQEKPDWRGLRLAIRTSP